ncbi:MAG TPA: hypothetical protein VGN83_12585 [Falsiroseomonas sp.]|nr:hypothetical protein [Falsiroseomonas sp.]
MFGATGDLARCKLLPALYHRVRDRQIPADSSIIAVSSAEMTDEGYRGDGGPRAAVSRGCGGSRCGHGRALLGDAPLRRADGRTGEGFSGIASALTAKEGRVASSILPPPPSCTACSAATSRSPASRRRGRASCLRSPWATILPRRGW